MRAFWNIEGNYLVGRMLMTIFDDWAELPPVNTRPTAAKTRRQGSVAAFPPLPLPRCALTHHQSAKAAACAQCPGGQTRDSRGRSPAVPRDSRAARARRRTRRRLALRPSPSTLETAATVTPAQIRPPGHRRRRPEWLQAGRSGGRRRCRLRTRVLHHALYSSGQRTVPMLERTREMSCMVRSPLALASGASSTATPTGSLT
jgi:hypothetical protein